MFARMVLPDLGGTPAVWNTCVVFFQAALLAGYAYAHLTSTKLALRHQAALHIGLMLLPFVVLPIAVPEALVPWLDEVHPALGLLALLTVGVGLPFFVVSATAPLLQRWFSATGHASAGDPYFLYAASNLGSMLALLAYPVVFEPCLHLRGSDSSSGQVLLLSQPWVWTFGYVLLLGLVVACAAKVRKAPSSVLLPGSQGCTEQAAPGKDEVHSGITLTQRLHWVLLAAVPSSLMLGATTFITTDVAPIPLLWVIPLALYLFTFILAFGRRSFLPLKWVDRLLPLVVLALVIVLLSEAADPVWLIVGIHLLTLFVLALSCHGQLARLRPDARHLTEFYFWLSLGGVLGGLFSALVAPLIFTRIVEYPLAVVLGCLLRQQAANGRQRSGPGKLSLDRYVSPATLDVLLPAGVGVLTALLVLVGLAMKIPAGPVSVAAMFALPALVCYTFLERPVRFGLGIGALLLASSLYPGFHGRADVHGRVVYRTRSFFGVHKVVEVTDGKGQRYRRLIHGNTVHGQQSLDPGRRRQPLTYYTVRGPIGQLFTFLNKQPGRLKDVAVVGLGAGSLAAFARQGQTFTFYEIDPAVIYLARDSGYFTFLKDSPAAKDDCIVEGDARLKLARAGDRYDLLVIDAFSSDALPVHLFTREALEIYLERLRDNGLLAFHISNNYVDISPMLAELAGELGLVGLSQDYPGNEPGEFRSLWVVMGRPGSGLEELRTRSLWTPLLGGMGRRPWTDDHADLLQLLK
jgi:hypothetical protein